MTALDELFILVRDAPNIVEREDEGIMDDMSEVVVNLI